MKPRLYYPVKPVHVNQLFGANVAYYMTKFNEHGHMGIDLMAEHGHPVYAANDGIAIYTKDSHGGEGVYIYGDGFVTIYWHLIGDTDPKYPLPVPFDNAYHNVKVGDLIGYADNTGAPFESTGDHLHFGLALTNSMKQIINTDNGTNGCIDPMPYFTNFCAQDISQLTVLEKTLVGVLQSIVNYYINKNK